MSPETFDVPEPGVGFEVASMECPPDFDGIGVAVMPKKGRTAMDRFEYDVKLKNLRERLKDVAAGVTALADNLDSLDKPAPAPDPPGWQEPWRRMSSENRGMVYTCNGSFLFGDRGAEYASTTEKQRQAAMDRAVACVNALAGIRNVAAVADLLARVRRLIEDGKLAVPDLGEIAYLLAALDKEPDGG
jgi:hypothetical protein